MANSAATKAIGRREWLLWMSLAGAGVGMGACGGGGSEDGGGGIAPPAAEPHQPFSRPGRGTPGAVITPEQRVQTFQALEAALVALWDFDTGRASMEAVLAWLESQAAFQTVGLSATRDVYAIFTDGRPLLVVTRMRTDQQGVTAVTPQFRADRAKARDAERHRARHDMNRRAEKRATAVPAELGDYEAGIPSRRFRVMNTFYSDGPEWPLDTWVRGTMGHPGGVASMLDPYTVTSTMMDFGFERVAFAHGEETIDSAPSVESLKSVDGDGVFFWMTHGGTLDANGKVIQGLMTGTTAYQSTVEDTYKDEFAEGTLLYFTGPLCIDPMACNVTQGEDGTTYTRLAITPKWIDKYKWRFGKHSLVFVNACHSANDPMKRAFLDAGASLYLGWTGTVRVAQMCGATMDVLSMMMGFNENAGGPDEEVFPRQRPHDWGAVMNLLLTQGKSEAVAYWDVEEGYVELEPTVNPSVPLGFVGLRPSIFQTGFNEETSELMLIGGMFGTEGGTAAVGTAQACSSVCYADWAGRADHALSDPVQVAVVDWQSSSVVLKLPASGTGSHGLVQVTVDGRWSNLVQLTRIKVPIQGTVSDGGSLQVTIQGELSFRCDLRGVRPGPMDALRYAPVPISSAVAGSLSFHAGGSYRYDQGQVTVTVQWSGSGEARNRGPSGEMAMLVGIMDPEARTGSLTAILAVAIDETIVRSREGYADEVTRSRRIISFSVDDPVTGARWPVEPVFDVDYAAPGERHDAVVPGIGHNQASVHTVLDFGPFSSLFPPTDNLGGR